MANETFKKQLGIDREGVKLGGRLNPVLLLVAVVVIFVSNAIHFPPPELQLVNYDEQRPTSGRNLFVVIRERDAAEEDRLTFLAFDANGMPRIKKTREDEIIQIAEEGSENRKKVVESLQDLKDQLQEHWGHTNLSEDVRGNIIGDVVSITDYSWTGGEFAAYMSKSVASIITNDIPILLKAQLRLVWLLLLFSLIPGIMGMIYRRAFGTYFLTAFVILYGINWAFDASGAGSITAEVTKNLEYKWTESALLVLEMLVVVSVLCFRLRRHTPEITDPRSKLMNILVGVLLILLAVVWAYAMWNWNWLRISWWGTGGVLILLLVAGSILWQSFRSATDGGKHRKNIVMCLDGTWNQPGMKDYGYLAETNVFKLFKMLKGTPSPFRHYNANRHREYSVDINNQQSVRQIGFYYHGVGNTVENSSLGQFLGGVFGMGASAIVERAYLDVVRAYRPDDRIFIVGFSRGAATARLLAGVIGRRGIPANLWTLDLFGRHWTVWKSSKKLKHDPTPYRDDKGIERDDVLIEVLGCWDTVGSFGIPKNVMGIPFQRINLLKDLTVSLCVKRAWHMLSLDENRDSFAPTLMDPDPTDPKRIIELWFSGNHANVGGGYATDKLSNVTLDFLLKRVSSGYACDSSKTPGDESWGLYLNAARKTDGVQVNETMTMLIDRDPLGRLRQATGAAYSYSPRTLPIHAVIHDTVFERMKKSLPVYAPQALFKLNKELVGKRADIETEVMRLADTHALNAAECENIRDWMIEKLSLMKWSQNKEVLARENLNPGVELANSPNKGSQKDSQS